MVVAGIDTDSRGSIALLDTSPWCLDVYPLPTLSTTLKSEKVRLSLDYHVLVAIMEDLIFHVDAAWLEHQWGRPGQSAPATYGFGQTNGDIRTAVAAGFLKKGLSLEEVRKAIHHVAAADWKPALGATADKAQTRNLASLCFPECAHAWAMVKHTSAAEAALIALYGLSQMGIKIPRGTIIKPYTGPERTTHARSITRPERGTESPRTKTKVRPVAATLARTTDDDDRLSGVLDVQRCPSA